MSWQSRGREKLLMCELFGLSGAEPVPVNKYLNELVKHSTDHPNGWGIAVFSGNGVNVEKEPLPAYKSRYLKARLGHAFMARNMMAHIRLATIGYVDYENCHPFVRSDCTGRTWTLMHNGTIFDCPLLNEYVHSQEGRTDSERILLYLVDCIDMEIKKKGGDLSGSERFSVIDRVIGSISEGNKVNLLIYDGEIMYVHSNFRDSLFLKKTGNCTLIATAPPDNEEWEAVPLNRPLGYVDGERIYTGTGHGNEYIFDPEHMRLIFLDSAEL